MAYQQLIESYLAGPSLLRQAIAGMTEEELNAAPIASKWSTRQVICHLSDFEPVYSDRIKRVIAEEQPLMMSGDPDLFASRLAYEKRDLTIELQLIETVRQHLASILLALPEEVFLRCGRHSQDGLLSIETLLKRITGHIPHHVKAIEDKRAALGVSSR